MAETTSKLAFVNAHAFDTRVRSEDVRLPEKILGYLFGPVGPLLAGAVLGSFLNVYYTDVLNLTPVWGGLFLLVFPIASKVLNAVINVVVGQAIERTRTFQGKARPWLLLSAPLTLVSVVLVLAVPQAPEPVQLVWVVVSYNLYYSGAQSFYNMAHNLMVPLSTRDSKARGSLSVLTNVATTMVTGIIVAMLFPTLVLPLVGVDRGAWLMLSVVLAVLGFVLTMVEYYFTRERVTEETAAEPAQEIPFAEQAKSLVSDKYWVVLMAYLLLYTLSLSFKNMSGVYYCNYVLGTYNDGITFTLVNVIGGIPMGIGIFAVWPIAKRFGLRNTTMGGFVLVAVGSALCWIFSRNLYVVLVGQFIKNTGCLPASYVFMALFADVLDHIEWRFGFRCDGLSSSIYAIIQTVCVGVANGVFNLMLGITGYVAPSIVNGATVAAQQTPATQNVFTFFFLGLDVITAVIIVFLLGQLDVEKVIDKEQAEIAERHAAAGDSAKKD